MHKDLQLGMTIGVLLAGCSKAPDPPSGPDAGPAACEPGHFGEACEPCACEPGDVCNEGLAGDGACTSAYAIGIELARIDSSGLSPFRVRISLHNHDTPIVGAEPHVEIPLGTASAISEIGGGIYELTVTPGRTGEYPITVSHRGVSVTRTALVLASVHGGWGQPQAVAGLVNTEGYEDGGTVTADGQYLFVQTGPWRMSGFFVYGAPRADGGCGGSRLVPDRCTHPWIDDTIGPTTAPERPGFFDGRFANGKFLHNSRLYDVGLEQAPIFAPMTMFYGFRRQPDGSYAEPFYLAFEDQNDAISNPFGMSFVTHGDGTATMAFSLDDPNPILVDVDGNGSGDTDSGFDVYTLEVTLGQNTVLGEFLPGSLASGTPPPRGSSFSSTLVTLGDVGTTGIYGTQGNPHLFAPPGGQISSMWTDDEYDRDPGQPSHADHGDLSVYVLTAGSYPDGSFTKVVLPAPINSAAEQIQPFFTGSGLYYTSDVELMYSPYGGTHDSTAYATAANWGQPERILGKSATLAVGEIIGVGEPSTAVIDGVEHLFFMYGTVRGFDAVTGIPDINMQMGLVPKRP